MKKQKLLSLFVAGSIIASTLTGCVSNKKNSHIPNDKDTDIPKEKSDDDDSGFVGIWPFYLLGRQATPVSGSSTGGSTAAKSSSSKGSSTGSGLGSSAQGSSSS